MRISLCLGGRESVMLFYLGGRGLGFMFGCGCGCLCVCVFGRLNDRPIYICCLFDLPRGLFVRLVYLW